jgi:hypothetical protein
MKPILFSALMLLFAASLFAQSEQNHNVDTLKRHSIGFNISQPISMLMGAQPSALKVPVLYKFHKKRYNYRLGFSFSPDFHNYHNSFYYEDEFRADQIQTVVAGEVVEMTEANVLKRFDRKMNYLYEINAGVERIQKLKWAGWFYGADISVGYLLRDESYFYRNYPRTDYADESEIYEEFAYISPNTAKPYVSERFLKTGVYFFTGFEWKLTNRFNVSALFSSQLFGYIQLSEDYSDEADYLKLSNFQGLDFNDGYINLFVSYKF